ncbi:peptide ABC transporter substrate-binding protein [Bacillus sp. AFS041924]|uniref:peptide ABC transporter substrate-binding protein n=1 Tax=Bacillus sp. AFS041924 TaxID=2033503 RepID=UPI000BFE1705|nr:peptide ABC transporter substrate-binding protein [Bacillus sp. AFS041924]PGS47012.1 peptide ABC transporter substrate-binding protein [Bacillus sp. AFS041924]
MKKKVSYFLSLSVAVSMLLTACNSDKTNEGGKKDTAKAKPQVLNLLGGAELPGLDSGTTTDAESFNVLGNIMEGLNVLGKDDVVQPGIAETTDKSEDGLTYTFHLRDAKWSNGEAVTAKDFEYAWKRAADPKNASEYAFMMNVLQNGEEVTTGKKPVDQLGVKAIDDKTLEVKLAKAIPYFDSLVTFPTFLPLNQKYVESQGKDYALEADKLIFNGPFELSEWKHDESYKLVKNPDYYGANDVSLKEINFKIVKDPQTAVNLYESGEVDRAGLTAEFVDKYKNNPDYGTTKEPTVFFLRVNETKNPALKNVNIRKALNEAFNREDITNVILNNGSVPLYGLAPSNFLDANGKDFREASGDLVKYDPTNAKTLWEQGLKEIDKKDVTIELLGSDTETNKKISEYLQGELTKNLPGLKINIKSVPFAQQLDLNSKKDYEVSFGGWGPDYKDPMTFFDMWTTQSPFNQMGFSNPEYDKLISQAGGEFLLDPAKRSDAFVKAEKILVQDNAAILPIYQRAIAYVMKPKVTGLIEHSFGSDYTYKNVVIK